MDICLAAYGNRIASLLETSDRLILVKLPKVSDSNLRTIPLSSGNYNEILKILQENGVDTLICGAIAGCVYDLFAAQNVHVIPWITGNVSEIIEALQQNKILTRDFHMPGQRNRSRFRHGTRRKFES